MTTIQKTRFKERVQFLAGKLDARIVSITVRPMSNKWASCSTAGRLTFDSALLLFPEKVQDYVIVHELLHFHVPNHGKLWKSLMRAHLGDYEEMEMELSKGAPMRSALVRPETG